MSIQIEEDELPAMMAVLVQGKFCPEPRDEAVAASPIVARIARRLRQSVPGSRRHGLDFPRGGPQSATTGQSRTTASG